MTKEILIKSALRALVNGEMKQGSAGYALEEDSAYEVSWKDVLEWLEQQPCEDCISRQAVKEMLTEEWTKYMPMELDTHLSFVLEKISELPSVTPSYNSIKTELYCISRQEVLDVLKDKWNMFSDANDAMQESIDTIEALPPVIPQPKTGRWIDRWDKIFLCENKDCSICGHMAQTRYNFCPNCGAKMEVEE